MDQTHYSYYQISFNGEGNKPVLKIGIAGDRKCVLTRIQDTIVDMDDSNTEEEDNNN